MLTELVVYTNEQGLKEVRKVPKDLHPADYAKGILVGPPDISELDLSEESILALNNALVDAGYTNYASLAGKRFDLLRLVQSTLDLSTEDALAIRLQLIGLYQQDYFE